MSVRSKPNREGEAPAKPERDGSQLPEGWTQCRVGDIFNVSSGGTPSRTEPRYWNGNVPWLSSGDIKTDEIEVGSEFITEAGLQNSTAKLCEKGSVVVVVRSGVLKHTLPVALLRRPAAINQDMRCFNSGDDDLNRWLALALRAASRDILAENREGTTVQSVKSETLREFALPLPPLAEQRRIVGKLELLLGKVSSSQQRLSRVPGLLKRFRQSVLAAACSGKLTADWRAENEVETTGAEFRDQVLAERQKKWTAAKKSSEEDGDSKRKARFGTYPEPASIADDELRDIPSDWTWASLDELCYRLTYGITVRPGYVDDGVPMISAREVRTGEIDLDKANRIAQSDYDGLREKCRIYFGDVLFSKTGTIGSVARVKTKIPLCSSQNIAVISPLIDSAFMELSLRSPIIQKRATDAVKDTAIPDLQLGFMARFPMALPPLTEQQEIVRRVEKLFAFADQIEARLRQAQAHIDRLTQSLLAKAFRGELVPTEHALAEREHRTYEPASCLLDRIRAESDSTAPRPANRRRSRP